MSSRACMICSVFILLGLALRVVRVYFAGTGFGRELGHWGVEEYLETKQVFINLDEKPIGWY